MSDRFHVVFSYGFRPFFLMAGLYGAFVIVPWILQIVVGGSVGSFPWSYIVASPVEWHIHEMLFGYVAAAIAGFFLTAVPNWTGSRPVKGSTLMMLSGLWLAGRIVNWFSALLPGVLVTIIDVAFFPVLIALVIRALIKGWSMRNFVFLPVMIGMSIANLLMHLEWLGYSTSTFDIGKRLVINLVITLIIILGGRIIPAFTTNALRKKNEVDLPRQSEILTKLAILTAVTMILADLLMPESTLAGVLAALVGFVNLLRYLGWRMSKTFDSPILWVLFMGFGFLILGLFVQSYAILGGTIDRNVADHLLMIGGAGGMTIAVMSRAGLGHTGRAIHAPWQIVCAYVLIALSAILRATAPVFFGEYYLTLISTAGCLWSLAFVLFSWVFWPVLTSPRA